MWQIVNIVGDQISHNDKTFIKKKRERMINCIKGTKVGYKLQLNRILIT